MHCAGCPDHSFKIVHTLSAVPFSINPELQTYLPFTPISTGMRSGRNMPFSTLNILQLSIGEGITFKIKYIKHLLLIAAKW